MSKITLHNRRYHAIGSEFSRLWKLCSWKMTRFEGTQQVPAVGDREENTWMETINRIGKIDSREIYHDTCVSRVNE